MSIPKNERDFYTAAFIAAISGLSSADITNDNVVSNAECIAAQATREWSAGIDCYSDIDTF